MHAMKQIAWWLVGLTAPLLLPAAQTTTTVPVGALSFTINAGSVAVPANTSFAIPLLDTPLATGAGVARISSLTSTTITATGAGWTAGALATAAFPYAFRITTGAAAGATFAITDNTTDTLTTTAVDFTTLGIVTGASGDSFRLIPVDTLNTLFGSTTLLGGTTATDADIVTLSSTSQLSYYYNTTLGRWIRTIGPTTDRGNTPISLDSAVTITRKSTALTLRFTGRVPDVRFSLVVANSGNTYTHTGFPTDVTLGVLSLQTALSGWVSAASASNADILWVDIGGSSLAYFHNGSYWQRTIGPATNRDSNVISAGTPIIIFKRGTSSGTSTLIRNLPYSL